MNDTDPAHALLVTRAHPDVIRFCEAYLDGEMRAQAIGISELFIEPST